MAVAFRASSKQDVAARTTITLTKPTGTTDGDLLIAMVGTTNAAGITISTVPTGWTQIQKDDGGGSVPVVGTYYKIASSEPASWDWVLSSEGSEAGGCVIALTGQATSSPINASGKDTVLASTAPSLANGFNPTASDGFLVFCGFCRGNNNDIGGYAIATDNPTWTEREEDAGGPSKFFMATASRAQSTDTGNSSLTGLDSSETTAHLIYVDLERNMTVTAGVLELTMSFPSPSVSGAGNATAGILELTVTAPTPTASAPSPDWLNQDKSSTATFLNQDKS